MSNSLLNVIRWSALGFGVIYGFTRQRRLTAQQKAAARLKQYQTEEAWIEEAKLEYLRQHDPEAYQLKTAHLSTSKDTGAENVNEIIGLFTGQLR